ncbi:hypothetical protein FOZ61_005286, partial [Perkinsus olseni]
IVAYLAYNYPTLNVALVGRDKIRLNALACRHQNANFDVVGLHGLELRPLSVSGSLLSDAVLYWHTALLPSVHHSFYYRLISWRAPKSLSQLLDHSYRLVSPPYYGGRRVWPHGP